MKEAARWPVPAHLYRPDLALARWAGQRGREDSRDCSRGGLGGASGAVRPAISGVRPWGQLRLQPLLSEDGCGASLDRAAASRPDRPLEGKKDKQIKRLFTTVLARTANHKSKRPGGGGGLDQPPFAG